MGRSGSDFTEWHYDSDHQDEFDCTEVREIEITSYVWAEIRHNRPVITEKMRKKMKCPFPKWEE